MTQREKELLSRTRLIASSRAFLSSVKLALLTLTSSRSLEGVGVIGNMERGWGVGVASEGESVSTAGSFPLTTLLPRAILCDTGGREREREKRREREERLKLELG